MIYQKVVVQQKSIGFLGLLTIAFIVLKLIGAISWSWWWVISPLWIPTVIGVLVLVLGFLGVLMFTVFSDRMAKRRRDRLYCKK